VCECGDSACMRVMPLRPYEYDALRSAPDQFAVVPGHELGGLEEVLRRTNRYVLVRQLVAAEVAA
jgi:hypothetical protein